eukprot:Pgem_evm2s5168
MIVENTIFPFRSAKYRKIKMPTFFVPFSKAAIIAMNATPPITEPTITPVLLFDELEVVLVVSVGVNVSVVVTDIDWAVVVAMEEEATVADEIVLVVDDVLDGVIDDVVDVVDGVIDDVDIEEIIGVVVDTIPVEVGDAVVDCTVVIDVDTELVHTHLLCGQLTSS